MLNSDTLHQQLGIWPTLIWQSTTGNPNELTEVHLSPDIEHIASIQDIFVTLQSAIHLYQLSSGLYEVSNHSPLLNKNDSVHVIC